MATAAKLGLLTPLHSHLRDEFPLFRCTFFLPKLTNYRFSQFSLTVKQSRNALILPLIKAQSSPDYIPDAKFYKVEAILSFCHASIVMALANLTGFLGCSELQWEDIVRQLKMALLKMGIRGVTVSDVRGFGAQGGSTERQGGSEFSEGKFVAKVKMEIVVSKDQVEAVIEKIIEEARTGEIGDGKIS